MIDSRYEIELTADGSATIYLPDIDEHYHSIKGAMTESCHIYRDCGLLYSDSKKVKILEIGFGTGLNALITALVKDRDIEYHTLELYPLSPEIIATTNYVEHLPDGARELYAAIHAEPVRISDNFVIVKHQVDFTSIDCQLPSGIDVVYYDAFAPEKQPEMWSKECFKRVYDAMNPSAILTTYCAKGEIRRLLQSTGFTVERIPGPPAGKREILRAIHP